jgi:hypothetical protein
MESPIKKPSRLGKIEETNEIKTEEIFQSEQ